MDILLELEQIKADFASAQATLEQANASKLSLETLLAERDADIAAARKAVSEANALVADKDLELTNIKASLEALKATQKTAEQKAVEIVAAQGIAPVKVDASKSAAKQSKEELVTQYLAISDPVARANFYFANKAALFGA